jgi:hypothetical protein
MIVEGSSRSNVGLVRMRRDVHLIRRILARGESTQGRRVSVCEKDRFRLTDYAELVEKIEGIFDRVGSRALRDPRPMLRIARGKRQVSVQ